MIMKKHTATWVLDDVTYQSNSNPDENGQPMVITGMD